MKFAHLFICSIISLLSIIMLTGCSTTQIGPTTLQNGKVYWTNSDTCAFTHIQKDNTTVSCFDKNKQFTGTIQPMSQEAITNYRYSQAIQQQQNALAMQQLNSSLQQMNQQLNQTNQQLFQNNMQMINSMQNNMPLYQPNFNRYNQRKTVYCRTIGNFVKCW